MSEKVGEWESVPKSSVSVQSAGDWESVPKSEKPGFGEKAAAFGYGLVTGIPGVVGDIESMLPGGPEVGAKGKGALKGYETVFPTTENIQQGLTKLGLPEPSKSVKGYKTAGEIAPAVVAGGKGIYELGKYGAKKLGGLLSGGKELAEELKGITSSRLAGESTKAGEKSAIESERGKKAKGLAQKETEKTQAAYSKLPGVTTETVAGEKKAVPQVLGDIGQRIKDSTSKVYESLKTTRSSNAEKNKAAAFSYAKQKEMSGARVKDTKAFEEMLTEVKNLIKDPETKLANATLGAIKGPLQEVKRALKPQYLDEATGVVHGSDASFASLEDLRRLLRDRSYGIPAEGFDAINQIQAGKLADKVEKVLSEFSGGKIDKFIKQYAADSKPLQVFQSKLGKALIGEQKGTNIASVAAQDIPSNAFKSRENFQSLVDALGGNTKAAQEEAAKYFVNKMESLKTGDQAQAFLRDNKEMLKTTGAYDIADKFAKQIINAERKGSAITSRGEERIKSAKEQAKIKNDLELINTDLNRASTIGEIESQVTKVANTLESNGLITVQQRDQMLNQMKNIKDLEVKREQVKKWMKYGVGALAGSGLAEAYRIYSK